MQTALTERWTPLIPHDEQLRLWHSLARFKVASAGRRSGKTERAKRKVVACALNPRASAFPDPKYFCAAPTRDQAKRIFWQDLKSLVPQRFLAGSPLETELTIPLITGAQISVIGMDKPERIEGSPWDGGILDEYANMKKQTWGMHIRPALSDRRGWCWLIGVPEGRNHYYDIDQMAQAEAIRAIAEGRIPEWDSFTWPSSDILPPEEIEAAKRDLDELTYMQEYEGSFVYFQGRAYYVFQSRTHCASLDYDPKQPLIFCFDFNVAPGVAAVCQEQMLPSGHEGTGVIGEVYIPRNSNTPAVCRRLVQDWGKHEGIIKVYGDSTGGLRGSAKVQGTDWDLVREEFKAPFGNRIYYRIPANPGERARINATNSRLLSHSGAIRLMVDPGKAPHVVKDFEGVRLLEGGSGEISKKADPDLTHLSDAIGYHIFTEYPTTKQTTTSLEFFV